MLRQSYVFYQRVRVGEINPRSHHFTLNLYFLPRTKKSVVRNKSVTRIECAISFFIHRFGKKEIRILGCIGVIHKWRNFCVFWVYLLVCFLKQSCQMSFMNACYLNTFYLRNYVGNYTLNDNNVVTSKTHWSK